MKITPLLQSLLTLFKSTEEDFVWLHINSVLKSAQSDSDKISESLHNLNALKSMQIETPIECTIKRLAIQPQFLKADFSDHSLSENEKICFNLIETLLRVYEQSLKDTWVDLNDGNQKAYSLRTLKLRVKDVQILIQKLELSSDFKCALKDLISVFCLEMQFFESPSLNFLLVLVDFQKKQELSSLTTIYVRDIAFERMNLTHYEIIQKEFNLLLKWLSHPQLISKEIRIIFDSMLFLVENRRRFEIYIPQFHFFKRDIRHQEWDHFLNQIRKEFKLVQDYLKKRELLIEYRNVVEEYTKGKIKESIEGRLALPWELGQVLELIADELTIVNPTQVAEPIFEKRYNTADAIDYIGFSKAQFHRLVKKEEIVKYKSGSTPYYLEKDLERVRIRKQPKT